MGLDAFGLPSPNYDMGTPAGVLSLILSMAVVGFAMWLSAKAVLRKDDFYRAAVAGIVGLLFAHLAYVLTDEYAIVGLLLGLVAFSLVTAAVYRAKPGQGFVVGAVAWVLWILATIALDYVRSHWSA